MSLNPVGCRCLSSLIPFRVFVILGIFVVPIHIRTYLTRTPRAYAINARFETNLIRPTAMTAYASPFHCDVRLRALPSLSYSAPWASANPYHYHLRTQVLQIEAFSKPSGNCSALILVHQACHKLQPPTIRRLDDVERRARRLWQRIVLPGWRRCTCTWRVLWVPSVCVVSIRMNKGRRDSP